MAMISDRAVHTVPAPADESHFPDAVSRPNLANGTHWYDEPALPSSPILKSDTASSIRPQQDLQRTSNTSPLKHFSDDGPSGYDGANESKESYDGGEEEAQIAKEDELDSTEFETPSYSYGNGDDTNYENDENDENENDSGGEDLTNTPLSVKDLSTRADMIMANARRRLNLVDGGLRGARSSLLLSPTSNSSFESQSSTPSPVNQSAENDESSQMGPQSILKSADTRFSSSKHKRITSDTSLPLASGSAVKGSRSLEHMRNRDYKSRQSVPKSSSEARNAANLRPVPENELSTKLPTQSAIKDDRRYTASPTVVGTGNMTFPIPPRDQSLAFRDLQHRANNVQGRIASLRKRNREDAERRRSLQSSRPSMSSLLSNTSDSPRDTLVDSARGSFNEERTTSSITPTNPTDIGAEEENPIANGKRDLGFPEQYQEQEQEQDIYKYNNGNTDNYAEYDEYDNDDDTDFYSIMEEPEYDEDDDDELPPVEGAHEDRADAFDYESFILSSLTGSLDRERRSSSSSSDSASTTKGPAYQSDDEDGGAWDSVRHSNASVSSFNSFATAIEGEEESDSASDGAEQVWPMPPSSRGIESYNHTRQNSTHIPPNVATKRPASMVLSALIGANTSSPALSLSQDDQALVYTMAERIREICLYLANGGSSGDVENWRKRLDEARRILEGQDTTA